MSNETVAHTPQGASWDARVPWTIGEYNDKEDAYFVNNCDGECVTLAEWNHANLIAAGVNTYLAGTAETVTAIQEEADARVAREVAKRALVTVERDALLAFMNTITDPLLVREDVVGVPAVVSGSWGELWGPAAVAFKDARYAIARAGGGAS